MKISTLIYFSMIFVCLLFLPIGSSADTEECRDAREQAESYRDDLEGYVKRLYRCVEGNDLTDDCDSEFRRVKSAYSDFESAVSDVSSYCN